MQKHVQDITNATFSSDRWIVRVIMAIGAGFAALQSNGNNWPGWVPATLEEAGYWLDTPTVAYRFAAWVMVILLAWVNWKPNGQPTA